MKIYRPTITAGLIGLLLTFISVPCIQASIIRISQESSPGAGDFGTNFLGTIGTFSTNLTAAAFYQYGDPIKSGYNGDQNGGPSTISDTSLLFFVDAADGMSLFVVHDRYNDGSGGTANMQFNLLNDTADFMVHDDSQIVYNDRYIVNADGDQFNTIQGFNHIYSDGFVIGGLDGKWSIYAQFTDAPIGITSWQLVAADGMNIEPDYTTGRRVRLDYGHAPEPGTLILFGMGLVGFAGYGRIKLKRNKKTG